MAKIINPNINKWFTPDLYKFLKDKGILRLVWKRINEQRCWNKTSIIDSFDLTFIWNETPEGHEYWNNIHREFISI